MTIATTTTTNTAFILLMLAMAKWVKAHGSWFQWCFKYIEQLIWNVYAFARVVFCQMVKKQTRNTEKMFVTFSLPFWQHYMFKILKYYTFNERPISSISSMGRGCVPTTVAGVQIHLVAPWCSCTGIHPFGGQFLHFQQGHFSILCIL